ncbi:MAG: protein translocase subunit SecD [Acidimicrobiales bacterium]
MQRKLAVTLIVLLVVVLGSLGATLATGDTPALGLDLQGGISVTQQPVGDFEPETLDLAVERIRDRVDALGVAEPEILRQGDAIVVNLPGVKNQQQAIDLVQVTGQVYLRPVQGCIADSGTTDSTAPASTDATGTTTAGTTGDSVGGSTPTTAATDTTAAPGPSRHVNSTPTTAASDTTAAPDTTTADTTTSGTDTAASTSVPADGTTDTTTAPLTTGNDVVSDPTQQQLLPLRDGGQCLVGPAAGTGEVFKNDASAQVIGGGWGVTVGLRDGSAGRDVWNQIASECYSGGSSCPSRQLAIELDGEIISAPTVNQPSFSTDVQITGSFTEGEAKNLANVLKSGSLGVTMKTQSVQNVSPTLGKDSLHAAVISGLIGVLLVLLLLVFYYRTLGLIVAGGLAVSSAILYTIISFLSRTQGLALSLAGVAGIIVSVGVTVDSYVVFFERLKDEVRAGRTLRNSAQRGFSGAWRTILIADVVSLIGAITLWWLTVGSVRNFAFFLGLSTLVDLVVSYFYTRPAVLLLSRTDFLAKRGVMGIKPVSTTATGSAS